MKWQEELDSFQGNVAAYYHQIGGDAFFFNADRPMIAASIIKLPILVAAYLEISKGNLDPGRSAVIHNSDKVPSCGVLSYLHDGLSVTVRDLLELMIIVSDNTAANMIIDRLGIENINDAMTQLGIPGIRLRRKLFDDEAAARGLQNTVTARGIANLLERLLSKDLLAETWDEEMLSILKNQKLNGKLPFFLRPKNIQVAHKTGEDVGITNDVGIVFARKPFVLCMLSNDVDVPAFERLIQDAALECWQESSAI